MINRIFGKVIEKNEKHLVVSFSSIAFDVFVFNEDKYFLENEYFFFIAMIFNAEKGYFLYGFDSDVEKKYFLLLCDCQGVGPKLALTVLAGISIKDLYSAILNKNQLLLESITGIGKKKAENIIIDLYRKIDKLSVAMKIKERNYLIWEDLSGALESLGYNQFQVKKIINSLASDHAEGDFTLSGLIQKALQIKI